MKIMYIYKKLSKLVGLLLFISTTISLQAYSTQTEMRKVELKEQDFINQYLKENKKAKTQKNPTIEVTYLPTTKKTKKYRRGQRLRETTQELEELQRINQRLLIERERLKLENQLLQEEKARYSNQKVTTTYKSNENIIEEPQEESVVVQKKRTRREYKRTTESFLKQKKVYKSRSTTKIYVNVDTVLKKMRVYRGSQLIYDWSIMIRESYKPIKKYRGIQSHRKTNPTQSYLRSQRKNPIFFHNGRVSNRIDHAKTKSNTVFSTVKLRQKHINKLNDLMRQYGKSNVIIKMLR